MEKAELSLKAFGSSIYIFRKVCRNDHKNYLTWAKEAVIFVQALQETLPVDGRPVVKENVKC